MGSGFIFCDAFEFRDKNFWSRTRDQRCKNTPFYGTKLSQIHEIVILTTENVNLKHMLN